MAVLPASKAYPRGGAPRREYVKGAPLFAKMALKFGGVDYPRGAELPIAKMSPHKHWELWMCGKADHVTSGPFDAKAKPEPVADAPEIQPREVTDEAPIVEGELPADATVTAGERIEAPTPDESQEPQEQPSKHRKRR